VGRGQCLEVAAGAGHCAEECTGCEPAAPVCRVACPGPSVPLRGTPLAVRGCPAAACPTPTYLNSTPARPRARAQLPASLVVVGVGVKPEVELFKEQLPMAESGGIRVDDRLRPCALPPASLLVG